MKEKMAYGVLWLNIIIGRGDNVETMNTDIIDGGGI